MSNQSAVNNAPRDSNESIDKDEAEELAQEILIEN